MKFDLPDPGEGITEADLVEWKVSPGEAVEADQSVASVETDKAVVDIPVPEAGEIDSLLVDEGQTAIVGEPFLEYTPESETDQEADQAEDNDDNTADETTDQTSEDEQALHPPTHPDKPIKAMPRVRQKAREHSVDLHDVAPTTTGRITLSDLNAYLNDEDTQPSDTEPSDTHEEAQASESTDNTDAETQETETSTPKIPTEDKETTQEEDDASEEQDSRDEQPAVPDDFTTFKPESHEFNAPPSQRGQSTTSNDAEHGSTGNTSSQSQTAELDHQQSPERTGQEHQEGDAGTQTEQTPSTQLTDEAAEQAQDTESPGRTTAEQREESSDPAKRDESESEEDVGQTKASREDEEDQDIADAIDLQDAESEPEASDSDAQRSESAQEHGEESTDKTETANKLNALSGTRAAIASTMRESLNTTAQTTITDEVDVTSLVKLHKAIKDDTDAPLTYLSYFVKAVTEALDEHHQFNATFKESGFQEHDDMNLGIAVDTDRGLFVPVLKNADHKGIENIAYSIYDLAQRTRNNDNDPEDFQDATFTVSSLGSIAGQTFTPILNPPEVGILGIGEIKQRPRYHDGELVKARVVHLSITIDHQVIDGADGARFLKTLRETLASPRELFPLQI